MRRCFGGGDLKNAKHKVLMGLLICLLEEQLQSVPLTRGDKHNLYQKNGHPMRPSQPKRIPRGSGHNSMGGLQQVAWRFYSESSRNDQDD
jgi:hypothetical protein